MDILKEEIMKSLTMLNKEWMNALKKGEQEGGVDLSEVLFKFSEITQNIDKHFGDAKIRQTNKGKKGFWG